MATETASEVRLEGRRPSSTLRDVELQETVTGPSY